MGALRGATTRWYMFRGYVVGANVKELLDDRYEPCELQEWKTRQRVGTARDVLNARINIQSSKL